MIQAEAFSTCICKKSDNPDATWGLTRPSVCFIRCTNLFKTEGERKKVSSFICLPQTLMSPPAFLLYLSPSLHLSLFPLSLPPQSHYRPAVGKSLIFLLRLLHSGISAVQCHICLYSEDIWHAQTHVVGLYVDCHSFFCTAKPKPSP